MRGRGSAESAALGGMFYAAPEIRISLSAQEVFDDALNLLVEKRAVTVRSQWLTGQKDYHGYTALQGMFTSHT